MGALFQRQKKRGGIIDIEAEKKKFLIETKAWIFSNFGIV